MARSNASCYSQHPWRRGFRPVDALDGGGFCCIGGSGRDSWLVFHAPQCRVVTDLEVPTPVTIGVLLWRFIVWRRFKNTPSALTSTPATVVHLPREPEPTHPADSEKGLDYAHKTPSKKFLSPPTYTPGSMEGSPSTDKPPLALNLDVSCGTATAQRSPLRSASFHPSAKTQSLSSRISARMSVDTKKLYVNHLGQ